MPYQEPDKHLDDIAHRTIGAAIEVHKQIGPSYLESLYEDALCIELKLRGISYSQQHAVSVKYKGHSIGEGRIDILVEDRLVVELKAVESLLPVHKAQVISYLKSTKLKLGLLINFNESILKNGLKRVIFSS